MKMDIEDEQPKLKKIKIKIEPYQEERIYSCQANGQEQVAM
jgi:hypothetical protein